MTCSNQTAYTGQNFCNRNSRFGKPTGMILALSGESDTIANFRLEANWLSKIKNQTRTPIMNMKGFTDNSTEAQYHEHDDGSRVLIEQGNYRFTASFNVSECTKKQIMTLRGFEAAIYLVYGDVIRGRSTDSKVTVVPIRVDQLNVEKATLPMMDGTPEMLNITVDLKDEKDLNIYDVSETMSWDVSDLDGLTEVTLSMPAGVSQAAILVAVDVASVCGNNTKPIAGLGTETTDWEIVGDTIVSVSESTTVPGRYLFVTSAAANADTINLAAPSKPRSDDVLVISSGAVTIAGIPT